MTRWLKYGFVLCVAVLLASASGAATLRVERDGTGDYTTIQPALDAVAAGDTVLIGPGEYPEMTNQYLPNAGGWFEVAGCIRVSNITLIGDSAETTLIGPAVYSGEVNIGIAYPVTGDLRLVNITVMNVNTGCHIDYGRLFVDGCHFEGNDTGIQWYVSGVGGGVWNSYFSSAILYSSGLFFVGSGQGVVIEGCAFEASSLKFRKSSAPCNTQPPNAAPVLNLAR